MACLLLTNSKVLFTVFLYSHVRKMWQHGSFHDTLCQCFPIYGFHEQNFLTNFLSFYYLYLLFAQIRFSRITYLSTAVFSIYLLSIFSTIKVFKHFLNLPYLPFNFNFYAYFPLLSP